MKALYVLTPFQPLLWILLVTGGCSQRATGPSVIVGVHWPQVQSPEPATGPQIAEYVVAAFEDSQGSLWFGTMNKGVARYDGKSLSYLTEKEGLCGNTIASIAEGKDGALWFAGHTGVCKYDGRTFTAVLSGEGRVRADRDGNIWIGRDRDVHRHDGSTLTAFDIPLGAEAPAYSIRRGRIYFEAEDSRGHLWFSTDGYGAFRFDGETFRQFTKQDGLCSNTVTRILQDRRGRIWFTCIQAYQPRMTGDGGLCRFDGQTFTQFAYVAGLGHNDLYSLYEERAGNIWIGATGRGAYRFDGMNFTLFDLTDRPDLTRNFGVQAIVEDRRGTLWFGFSGGLFRFDWRKSLFVNVTQDGPWQ